MTHAEEADALALLRAMCEWTGQASGASGKPYWEFRVVSYSRHAEVGLDILRPPYCDTLLGEVTRRLLKDGWYVDTRATQDCDVTLWAPLSHDGSIYYEGTDADHIILAVARAARDAGIISTETKT